MVQMTAYFVHSSSAAELRVLNQKKLLMPHDMMHLVVESQLGDVALLLNTFADRCVENISIICEC